MIDYTNMGNRITERRKELYLTQEALAEQAGISVSFMGHIERGSRIASLDTLLSICIALDVSMDYITGRTSVVYVKALHETFTDVQCRACAEILTVMRNIFGQKTE